MDTISITAAAVTGARHQRASRNGQDAVATWRGADSAVVVVADGCGSGPSSEVGARLGATLFARLLGARLARAGNERVDRAETWAATRVDVVAGLADLLERVPGDRAQLIHDCWLFTIVAAAVTPDGAAVWALGDGAYSFGDHTRVLGPFADNQPPYLAYDLLGDPREAHFAIAPAGRGTIIIATDGACDLDSGLERFATPRLVGHPDALRRQLAILARGTERIEWDERRVVRTPAMLQDDCAVGVLQWRVPS